MNNAEELYQEIILDHYKNPRCKGKLKSPTAEHTLLNPLCGDRITVSLEIENDLVKKVMFDGVGCAISRASASMMAELCSGKSKQEILALEDKFSKLVQGEVEKVELSELGDAAALGGVRKFSARIKCALLAWEAIKKALE